MKNRKILSLVLAIAMLVGMFSFASMTVSATEAAGTATVVAGTKDITVTLTTGQFATPLNKTVWTIGGTDGASLGAIVSISRISATEAKVTVTNNAATGKTYTIKIDDDGEIDGSGNTAPTAAISITVTAAANNSDAKTITSINKMVDNYKRQLEEIVKDGNPGTKVAAMITKLNTKIEGMVAKENTRRTTAQTKIKAMATTGTNEKQQLAIQKEIEARDKFETKLDKLNDSHYAKVAKMRAKVDVLKIKINYAISTLKDKSKIDSKWTALGFGDEPTFDIADVFTASGELDMTPLAKDYGKIPLS